MSGGIPTTDRRDESGWGIGEAVCVGAVAIATGTGVGAMGEASGVEGRGKDPALRGRYGGQALACAHGIGCGWLMCGCAHD